jgi:hypothetical protein
LERGSLFLESVQLFPACPAVWNGNPDYAQLKNANSELLFPEKNEARWPVADVYKSVNLVRERAGLTGLEAGLSKDQMRNKIRHERRIELAFEGHRFFDVRRWKIAEQTDNV